MKTKRLLIVAVVGATLVLLIASGWVYSAVGSRISSPEPEEMLALRTSFVTQYGPQSTIQQMVSPTRMYAALWTDSSGASHVSWNIGGLWVTVYNSPSVPTPVP